MQIRYLGHACFLLESEKGVKILTDPYTKVGYELPKGIQTDIATISHSHFDHNYLSAVKAKEVISEQGEYTYSDIKITGQNSWHDEKQGALRGKNVLFTYEIDGCKICHFGDLGEPYSEERAKKLKESAVWLIPVGGTYTLNAKQAREYIEKLAPKIVIPMHYRPMDGALDISEASVFLDEMQGFEIERCPSGVLQMEKQDLQRKSTKIIYMERTESV